MLTRILQIQPSFYTDSRYYQDDGEVNDGWQHQAKAGYPFGFDQLGEKERYVLIDLCKIKADIESGCLQLHEDLSFHEVRKTLDDFDFYLITPLDREQKMHFKMRME